MPGDLLLRQAATFPYQTAVRLLSKPEPGSGRTGEGGGKDREYNRPGEWGLARTCLVTGLHHGFFTPQGSVGDPQIWRMPSRVPGAAPNPHGDCQTQGTTTGVASQSLGALAHSLHQYRLPLRSQGWREDSKITQRWKENPRQRRKVLIGALNTPERLSF